MGRSGMLLRTLGRQVGRVGVRAGLGAGRVEMETLRRGSRRLPSRLCALCTQAVHLSQVRMHCFAW